MHFNELLFKQKAESEKSLKKQGIDIQYYETITL